MEKLNDELLKEEYHSILFLDPFHKDSILLTAPQESAAQ